MGRAAHHRLGWFRAGHCPVHGRLRPRQSDNSHPSAEDATAHRGSDGDIAPERTPTGTLLALFGTTIIGGYLVSFGTLDPIWNLPNAEVTAAALAVGAAMLWGASTVMGRFLLRKGSFSTVAAARFTMPLPFLAVLALFRGEFVATFDGMATFPGRLFLVALIPGLLALLIYYEGLSRTQASFATLAVEVLGASESATFRHRTCDSHSARADLTGSLCALH